EVRAEDVLSQRIDLAFTRRFQPEAGVSHEVLLWERPGVYASAQRPLSGRDEVPAAALKGQRVRTLYREIAPLRYDAVLRDLRAGANDLEVDPTMGLSRELTTHDIAAGDYVAIGYATAGPVLPGI